MTAQPFWTSKTFWTMLLGLLALVGDSYFAWGIDPKAIGFIMGLLGVIFRWTADQPLSMTKPNP
jgi:hypothetical protein